MSSIGREDAVMRQKMGMTLDAMDKCLEIFGDVTKSARVAMEQYLMNAAMLPSDLDAEDMTIEDLAGHLRKLSMIVERLSPGATPAPSTNVTPDGAGAPRGRPRAARRSPAYLSTARRTLSFSHPGQPSPDTYDMYAPTTPPSRNSSYPSSCFSYEQDSP